jgi:hypothetical protein
MSNILINMDIKYFTCVNVLNLFVEIHGHTSV